VLLSLLAGVSRTAFAMAANGDLPRWLASVHPRHRVPDHAEVAAGAIVACVVIVADVRDAIGFSSFAVLLYYAIANAAAVTLRRDARDASLALPVAGLFGCVLLASSLPLTSIVPGLALVAVGCLVYWIRSKRPS
jgi:APA family basic amino acid/polyamine antiporter